MECHSIDAEWSHFLTNQNTSGLMYTSVSSHTNKNGGNKSENINTNAAKFCADDNTKTTIMVNKNKNIKMIQQSQPIMPVCEELYISTKTKVLFLNQEIDIQSIFWKINIIEYWKPEEGIVKKQMKIV
jgi:hypothetical protein